MVREILSVPLENASDIFNHELDGIIKRWQLKNNTNVRMTTRYVSIDGNEKISDNILNEIILNDKIIALIYRRRNQYNTLDILIYE